MFQFNARQYDPTVGIPVLPNGKHPVIIRKSNLMRVRPPKQGGYLALDMVVIDGPNKDRTHVERLNLWNENAQTVEIANKLLSAICHVLGVYDVNGTEQQDNAVAQLHNQPFVIETMLSSDGQNANIRGVYTMTGQPPQRQGQGAPSGAPQGFPQQGASAPPAGAPGPGWGAPPAGAPPAQQPPAQGPGPGWGAPAQGQPPAQGPAWGAPQGGQPPAGPGPGPAWGGPPQGQPQMQQPPASAGGSWGAPQGGPGAPPAGGDAPWGQPS